jgi:hypothetical protein
MTDQAAYCEARKVAYRQTKDGLVVSFVVHPNDMPDELATAPLGTRYMLALAEIGDDEEPVEVTLSTTRPNGQAARYRAAPVMEQALIRAAALPRDARFRAWVGYARSGSAEAPEATERGAIEYIRETCCAGGSRALIAEDGVAFEKFLQLEQDYLIAIGAAAEPR